MTSIEGKNALEDLEEMDNMQEYHSSLNQKRINNKRYMEIIMRGCSAAVLLMILQWGRSTQGKTNVFAEGFCLNDKGHKWTAGINDLVHESKAWLSFFEITSSLIMDTVFVSSLFYWLCYSKNGYILWNCGFFYAIRGII